ncbi:TPA: LOW QUALITY PROTEIN: hypothetical protein N0F65_000890 [Lagenidium giganteum]|uniref:P-type ATPase A domain-containing protein n=1 Tax=Lagenidium giganteum TaxID=4803 RepID=A0AAV2YXB9_9STRA|nr:TPA: LOW QUALITY PROTEIN: hypothetical protein N0F65_000890 [Lagenidium giganteum]
MVLVSAIGSARSEDQRVHPGCPSNHAPQYYCCTSGDGKSELFTRYQRPQGGDYESYYADAWKLERRVNFPEVLYTPSTPDFTYDNPDHICRIQTILRSDGATHQTLQCASDHELHDGIEHNASLAKDSRDFNVFWTSTSNPRNNNASFPIGATCVSLMLGRDTVDEAAKKNCFTLPAKSESHIKSFSDCPLLLTYLFYGVWAVGMMLWLLARVVVGYSSAVESPKRPERKMTITVFEGYNLSTVNLLEDRAGPPTPILTSEEEEAAQPTINMSDDLFASAQDILQIGYRNSAIGTFLYKYFVVATVWLFVMALVLILDNNNKLGIRLFDKEHMSLVIFLAVWLLSLVWLVFIAIYSASLRNLFRLPTKNLAKADYVYMFKSETSSSKAFLTSQNDFLQSDLSKTSRFLANVERKLFPNRQHGYSETVRVHRTKMGLCYVEFQYLRFSFMDEYNRFMPGTIAKTVTGMSFAHIHADAMASDGLSLDDIVMRRNVVGSNELSVTMPTKVESIYEEVLGATSWRFFYIYQLLCYYIWYYYASWGVALANTIIIVFAAVVNIVSKRQMLRSIVQMAKYNGGVSVKRDGGVWQVIKAVDLVPGDIVRVASNWQVPADLVVFHGPSLSVSEASLTGESMPVQKFPIPADVQDVYVAESVAAKKYTLYAGTTTLSSTGDVHREEEVLAIVQATGAHTVRGQLLQSILYPLPLRFKFYQHMKLLVLLLFLYGLLAAFLAIHFLATNDGLHNTLVAFVYGIFMLSAVLSPLIPVVMTMGQVNVTRRLRKNYDVMSLDPQRVTMAGKVRVFCFDKTGTITKEGLTYRGCLPISATSIEPLFDEEMRFPGHLSTMFSYALASCHSLGVLNGDGLSGSEVERCMFEVTGWKLVQQQDGPSGAPRTLVMSPDEQDGFEILKHFEFDHERMSMSVVVEHVRTQKRFVFTKGSHEQLREMCVSDTLPADLESKADAMACQHGCYVLGMGYRDVSNLSSGQFTRLLTQRHLAEERLTFVGLVLFQNQVKEDSKEVIERLREADIRCIMITGDNALTECHVARQCGMVSPGCPVVLGDIVAQGKYESKALVWRDVDTGLEYTTKDVLGMVDSTTSNVELAVTMRAFEFLLKMEQIRELLFHIRIFSRMTPTAKVECVAQHMARGAITGMCGDGGNDCGALRVAHVGVALSRATQARDLHQTPPSSDFATDASLVAPFTSKNASLLCVIHLIREGRGALATSFACIKFLVIYGLIGSSLRYIMYRNSVFMAQWAFIFCDGAVLVGLSHMMTLAKPAQSIKLNHQRPTSSLMGFSTICSVAGQVFVHSLFLRMGLRHLRTRSWYCPFSPDNVDLIKWWLLEDTHLGSLLFFLVAPQQMISAVAFSSLGSHFRVPLWRNAAVLLYFLLLLSFMAFLLLSPPSRLTDFFRVASSTNVIGLPDVPMPFDFRAEIALMVLGNMAAAVLFEAVGMLGPHVSAQAIPQGQAAAPTLKALNDKSDDRVTSTSPLTAWPTYVAVAVSLSTMEKDLQNLLCGGRCTSRTAVAPLERLKILFQYNGVWQSLRKIGVEEGLRGYFRGNGANCARVFPYTAIQFAVFERMKPLLMAEGETTLSPLRKLFGGATAGVASVIVTYPLDFVRARLTVQGGLSSAQYTGIVDALRGIYRHEGLIAMYRGVSPTILGVTPYVGLNFMVFETLRATAPLDANGRPDAMYLLGCGACGQTAAYPMDLLRRRFQLSSMSASGHGAYTSTLGGLRTIVREEGFGGLYKGLWPNFIKVVPSIAIMFTTNELFNRLREDTA